MGYIHREYPEFSWSIGRFKLLENCERRYYYNYYASHNGWLWNASSLQKESYLLKKLNNRFSLSGDIVHKTIKRYIESINSEDNEELSSEIINKYIQKAVNDFNFHLNKSKEYGSNWNTKIKDFKMMEEFYYNENLDIKQQEHILDNISKCIDNFFESKTLNELFSNNFEILENDEDDLSNFNFSGIKVYAKLDLLYKIDDKYIIVDWKTGKEEEIDYIQLLLYAKYVTQKYQINIEDIVCRVEYLKTNSSKEFVFSNDDIEQSNYLILGSISTMLELLDDIELNKAKPIDSFSKCIDKENCKSCNFRKICNK